MPKSAYTLEINTDDEYQKIYSRKEYAVRAGEAFGEPYRVLSPSGQVIVNTFPEVAEEAAPEVAEEAAPPEPATEPSEEQEDLIGEIPAKAATDEKLPKHSVVIKVNDFTPTRRYFRVFGPVAAALCTKDGVVVTRSTSKDCTVTVHAGDKPLAHRVANQLTEAFTKVSEHIPEWKRGEAYKACNLNTTKGRYDAWQLVLAELERALTAELG